MNVCTDKNVTQTQIKMTVQVFFTSTDKKKQIRDFVDLSTEARLLSSAMVLASDATLVNGKGTGDPTEIALLHLAETIQINRKDLQESQPRIDERAFDSTRKMMSTLHQHEDGFMIYAKGAIDSLILKCNQIVEDGENITLNDTHKTILMQAANAMSDKALRTLAVAYKPLESQIDSENF